MISGSDVYLAALFAVLAVTVSLWFLAGLIVLALLAGMAAS